ncbi:LysR family transcriptional regulator [Glaesserella sp.]|uniref:LysR family transcriptional regulator n=1 Tax=Glaesserella sp. TaxID=2094731 RepID=UPI0035A1862E
MNKFEAIKYFCLAAETLNFRETAKQLSISPSAVSRVISELEHTLGEQLFKRNTRQVQLTSFGEKFLIQAKQLMADTDSLFKLGKQQTDDMAGVVRITFPRWRDNDLILDELLQALEPYPQLVIDWREDMTRFDTVAHRIDIGVRIGIEPNPNFIIRKIADMQDWIVASPKLLARLGMPKNLDDLQRNYPFSLPINVETGRAWELNLNNHEQLQPRLVNFYSTDPEYELKAVLMGHSVGFISELFAKPYLENGELVKLFADLPIDKWQLYLYRPYQTMISARVKWVFDTLGEILHRRYAVA